MNSINESHTNSVSLMAWYIRDQTCINGHFKVLLTCPSDHAQPLFLNIIRNTIGKQASQEMSW